MPGNKNPEQIARDRIDAMLSKAGWNVQDKDTLNWAAGPGIAIREYQTSGGWADYILFVGQQPVGLIEAKAEDKAQSLSTVEEQTEGYRTAKLKYLNNDPLPFAYESTGEITYFTNHRDPKPRARRVFYFHRPETFRGWLKKEQSLRGRLHHIPALNPGQLRACQINAVTDLEQSFREARPRALIQMATGAGKTYTAITSIY
ncbi:MAG: DEAD/DEAH box helicase family protein [Phaeodactylibacter sp.]|nr:DEAD/DEAH box helicase family protein [Phaeodactylibacter sp.]